MSENNNFEVIIGGGGVSGLLLASELSKYYKVLVIESKDRLQTNKFWVTLKTCLDSNPHLNEAKDFHFKQMEFSDSSRNTHKLDGDYLLWDTHKLLNILEEIIIKNGSAVSFSQRFSGYKLSKDSIEIYANHFSYRAKLFIDCMGYNSPLIFSKDVIRLKGYYLLYGAKLKLKDNITPVCLSNVILHKNPKYFELFPTSHGEAYAVLISPTNKITTYKELAEDFTYLVTKSIYSKSVEAESIKSKIFGTVPVGLINKKALNRIFFFGESAQSNPAATGACLTRLLLKYKNVTDFLVEKIKNDDLNEHSLSASPAVLDDFNRKLQLNVFEDILSSNSDRYSKFINTISNLDNELVNRFIFGELSSSEIFDFDNIKNFIRRDNFLLLKPILKSII